MDRLAAAVWLSSFPLTIAIVFIRLYYSPPRTQSEANHLANEWGPLVLRAPQRHRSPHRRGHRPLDREAGSETQRQREAPTSKQGSGSENSRWGERGRGGRTRTQRVRTLGGTNDPARPEPATRSAPGRPGRTDGKPGLIRPAGRSAPAGRRKTPSHRSRCRCASGEPLLAAHATIAAWPKGGVPWPNPYTGDRAASRTGGKSSPVGSEVVCPSGRSARPRASTR